MRTCEPADEHCEDPDSEKRKSSRNRNCAADPCKIDQGSPWVVEMVCFSYVCILLGLEGAAGPVFGDPCDFFCLGNGAADEETMEQSWNSFGSMEGDDSVFNLLSGPRHSSGLECTDAVRIGKVTGRRAA